MLGKTLVSRYKIVAELGRGSFGQTFIAEDMHLPESPKCVIKQLKPLDNHPTLLEASRKFFEREAQVLYKLGKHNRIPTLLAHFEEGSEFYLAQEFIEGCVLSKEIFPGNQLSESYTVQLLRDFLQVLEFVHQQNVIHRDIKPSNLIRRASDNKIALIDFGAVKETSLQTLATFQGRTNSTLPIGTHGYMPDEQANGRPKFASDIYATGMLCIQALTGILPSQFPENLYTGEVIWRDLVPSIRPELADILEKMVRSHFTQRYQSAGEVLEALQKLPSPVASIPTLIATTLPTQSVVLSAAAKGISPTEIQPFSALPVLPVTLAIVNSYKRPVPDPCQTVLQPVESVSNQPQALNSPRAQPKISQPVLSKIPKRFLGLGVGTIAVLSAIASSVGILDESDRRTELTNVETKAQLAKAQKLAKVDRQQEMPAFAKAISSNTVNARKQADPVSQTEKAALTPVSTPIAQPTETKTVARVSSYQAPAFQPVPVPADTALSSNKAKVAPAPISVPMVQPIYTEPVARVSSYQTPAFQPVPVPTDTPFVPNLPVSKDKYRLNLIADQLPRQRNLSHREIFLRRRAQALARQRNQRAIARTQYRWRMER